MYIAIDGDENLVYVDWAVPGREYYCPVCRGRVSTRRGEIRHHYFAHYSSAECSDTWDSGYDMSEWHKEWQERFPIVNREVVVKLGNILHRADILTGKTVIEFQHSSLSGSLFDKRNAFYHDLGYKVVWLFDLTKEIKDGKLTYNENDAKISFEWKNPRTTFGTYELEGSFVELFFQMGQGDKAIVKVSNARAGNFTSFSADKWYSENDFLNYFHCTNGNCPEPIRDDISTNIKYHILKEKYEINLDRQQERAVENVEGATLVLAVPGSGKTTTLVSRIGYMVNCKGIDGNSILALTYTKSAAADMKKRYTNKFGVNDSVQFRTINSIADEIVRKYVGGFHIVEANIASDFLREIYKERHPYDYVTDGDIKFAKTTIAYIKNMMLSEAEIKQMIIWEENAFDIYEKYCSKLSKMHMMDFDDQLVMAYKTLRDRKDVLDFYQNTYKFFCIDEAQDTSKVQYEMIKLLASSTNNIFMVGDEDQSIYRFRAAYPEALLNFENEYPNPFVLQLETNYRSTPEIVDRALVFISKNRNRYPKRMNSVREKGEKPKLIYVETREEQYERIIEACMNASSETAILYRDNACVLPIADRLLKKNVPFRIRKPDETMFFDEHIVRDIKAFLNLAINNTDTKAFKQIYYKCGLYIKGKDAKGICGKVFYEKKTLFDAMYDWFTYGYRNDGKKAETFRNLITSMMNMCPADAIGYIYSNGYGAYLREKGLPSDHIEILIALARQDKTIQDFFNHLDSLKQAISEIKVTESNVILSTVHSSKGLEYDTVYIMDVFDGMFPSFVMGNERDKEEHSQEERRVFYVAMTRAKNHLYMFDIGDKDSSYITELFPYGGKRLDSVLRNIKYGDAVRNIRNGRTYAIDVLSDGNYWESANNRFNAVRIDFETGEILEKNANMEVNVDKEKSLWEVISV